MPHSGGADGRRGALVAIVLVAGGLLLGASAPAAAPAAGSSLTADPATGLVDGQFVKLTYQVPANQSIAFRQCIAAARVVATDCTATYPNLTPQGPGSGYMPVYSGSDPNLRNSGGTGSVRCDAANPCVIAGMPNTSDLTTALLAPIAFGPSPDACPPPGAGGILGGGSLSAYRAIYLWESTVCGPPSNLSVGYTVTNSRDGEANFTSGVSDFAVGGPLASPADPPAGSTLTLTHAPLTASAVTLGYRMFDPATGSQITTLTLSPRLVARMYLGKILGLTGNGSDDQNEIDALNPGIHFPTTMGTFARAEHSSQTFAFTSWLAAAAPTVWTGGVQDTFRLPPSGVSGVTGNVGAAVADPTTDPGRGTIGFMDSSTAAFYGLPTVRIRKADGTVIGATTDAITDAITHAAPGADGTVVPDYAGTRPAAYPVPMVSYLLVPTSPVPPDRRATLSSFLRYSAQAGQQNLPQGYAPLPPALVTASLQAADRIGVGVTASSHAASSPTGSPAPPAAGPAALTPSGIAPTPAAAVSQAVPSPTHPVISSNLTSSVLPVAPPSCPSPGGPSCHASKHASTLAAGPGIHVANHLARLLLPGAVAIALVGVIVGPLLQVAGRRRGSVADALREWLRSVMHRVTALAGTE